MHVADPTQLKWESVGNGHGLPGDVSRIYFQLVYAYIMLGFFKNIFSALQTYITNLHYLHFFMTRDFWK